MDRAVAALVGGLPQLKMYTEFKGKAGAERRHHIGPRRQEPLLDPKQLSWSVVGDCTSDLPGTTMIRTPV